MNKKSQGLSVNLIIIVAIALVILVVVIAIFTGKMGDWVGQTKGTDSGASDCSGKSLPGTYSDVGTGKFCCCT